jgi:hypothetical protein
MEREFNINVLSWVPTPGPSDYVDRDHFGDGPKAGLRGRIPPVVYRVDADLVRLKSDMGEGHKYTLHGRPPRPSEFVPPGPKYLPPAFGEEGPEVKVPRSKPVKKPATPGPADYHISPRALHSFGLETPRTAVRQGGPRVLWEPTYSPGPACYKVRHDAQRSSSPKWTIKGKYKDRPVEKTGEHIGPRSTLHGPKWSFSTAFRPPIMHSAY